MSISAFNREPYITENRRSPLGGGSEEGQPEERKLESEGNPFTILAIIGLIVTVAIVGSAYYVWKREEEAEQERAEKQKQAEKQAEEAAKEAESQAQSEDLNVQDTELEEGFYRGRRAFS